MPVSFASPEVLLLLPVVAALVVGLARRSLAGLEPVRRRLAVGLRLVLVTLFVLALAEVRWRDPTERVEVVFAVDLSRSVPDDLTAAALDLVDAARRRMDPRRDRAKLVAFARDAFIEARLERDGAKVDRVGSALERSHTSFEAALRRALEAVDPDARGRVVLLSDGNVNLGDTEAAVARARAAQVPVDVVPLEYAFEDEVLVEKVVLPGETKAGEPFLVRVVTHAQRRTRARLHLWQEGALVTSREVTLEPGANVESFQLQLDRPDFYRVEAVVEPVEPGRDRLAQNNTAHGFVFARGKASVLYVHDDEDPDAEQGAHLLAALRREQLRVVVTRAAGVPHEPMALQGYDAVVLDDVSRASLSERQQVALSKATGDFGVGLVMIGGERSFGAGDWRGSPVEDALPVEMEIKQEEVLPDGSLVMIIHACELPEGNAMAVKVCKKAVDGLSARDQVGVLVYGNTGNEWAVRLQPARNKIAIKGAIDKMGVGDMPDFDGIFRLALESLKGTRSAVKHMILMSDGDPSPPAPDLLAQCRDAKITVSTICYFAHDGIQGASAAVMRRIANATGGKFYYLEKADDLPRIFIKEAERVARALIVETTFVPVQRGASPVLTGVRELPPLRGYVLTEPKPRVDVPLVGPDGSPILAHWQFGVGKALAFTSDAKARWAADWIETPAFQKVWGQALRWVAKGVAEGGWQVATAVKGDRGQILLDAVSPDLEVLDDLTVVARVVPPQGGETLEVPLRPRGGGRYEGDFPVDQVGTYSVNVLGKDQDGNQQSSQTGLVYPYSDEYQRLRSDRAALERLARDAGGRVLEPAALRAGEVDPWDRTTLAERVALEERWPWLLALAVAVLLLDVAVRRVAIDWDRVWARAAAVVLRRPAPGPAVDTMARLRERKTEVRDAAARPLAPAAGAAATSARAPAAQAAAGPGDDAPTGPPVVVAGAEGTDLGPAPGAPGARPSGRAPAKPGDAADGPGAGAFTNRLLEAKRRARQELDTAGGDKPADEPGAGPGPRPGG